MSGNLASHLLHPAVPALLALDERHGLTRALGARPSTTEALAERLGLDARAVELVLEVLRNLGRCDRAPDGVWRSDPDVQGFPWSGLEAFLRSGELAVDLDDPATRDRAYRAAVATLAAREHGLAGLLAAELPIARRVLDVGAGAGPWSLALADRDPEVRVTAVDRPEVLPVFREAARTRGLGDRIAVIAASWDEPFPEAAFDRVVLANVLHLLPPLEAAALVARAAGALAPGGDVVIVDCVPREDGLDGLICATYALHLGLRTRRGGVHPLAALRAWCADAGLTRTEVLRLPGHAGLGAVRSTGAAAPPSR